MQQKRLWHERIDEEARMMTAAGPYLRPNGDTMELEHGGIRTREYLPVYVLCIRMNNRVKRCVYCIKVFLDLFSIKN